MASAYDMDLSFDNPYHPRALRGRGGGGSRSSSSYTRSSYGNYYGNTNNDYNRPSGSGGTNKAQDALLAAWLGAFMICFALPMIWYNERKDVKIYKLIQQG